MTATKPTNSPLRQQIAEAAVAPTSPTMSVFARVMTSATALAATRRNLEYVCDALDAYGEQLRDEIRQTLEQDADNLECRLEALESEREAALEAFRTEMAAITRRTRSERHH